MKSDNYLDHINIEMYEKWLEKHLEKMRLARLKSIASIDEDDFQPEEIFQP